MGVTASLVVNFGDVEDAYLSAEILDLDNEGKTSFSAGDTVYFRVYHSCDYELTETAGTTSTTETDIIQNIKELTDDGKGEVITFAFSGTTSTGKLIDTVVSSSWMGTALGTIAKSGYSEVSGGLITKANGGSGLPDSVGVARVDYNTKYDLCTLNSPAEIDGSTNYSIVVGITAVL